MFVLFFESIMYIFVLLVCVGLVIDVFSVSMRFNAVFCIYEHIRTNMLVSLFIFVRKLFFVIGTHTFVF